MTTMTMKTTDRLPWSSSGFPGWGLVDSLVSMFPAGDPNQAPSLVLGSIAAMGIPAMERMLCENGVTVARSCFIPVKEKVVLHIPCREKAVVTAPGVSETFILLPEDHGDEVFHGKRVPASGRDVFYAEYGLLLAGILARTCQDFIFNHLQTFDGRSERYFKELYSCWWKRIEPYRSSEFYRSFGLSVHRFAMFSRLMYVYGLLKGKYGGNLGEPRLLIPQARKPKWQETHQYNTPLRRLFSTVDYDGRMSRERVAEFDSAFEEMESHGMFLPLVCVDLRFRRLGDMTFDGRYYRRLKLVLVDPNKAGCFMHEYGHALDHSRTLSESVMFVPLYERYRELISSTEYFAKCSNQDYYLQKTEAFARMFERYVFLRNGTSFLNGISSDAVHPDDSELDAMTMSYFDWVYGLK